MKRLVVFDLDGTLAETKSALIETMVACTGGLRIDIVAPDGKHT